MARSERSRSRRQVGSAGLCGGGQADIWSAAAEVMTYSVDRRYGVIT
ncbi:hypothetical protein X768_32020 [Mesorhizobium sp. LSJC265A00]|nr:hypothetical protein X768_32020 [Mesorhizobium sp. LSJC265A00]ESZ40690.1 hypothetical protein X730_30180 [Mesorhizobium sp. L103C565B0]